MPMKNPPHPGRSVRENCLDPLGLSVTEAAEVLGVARHTRCLVQHTAGDAPPSSSNRLGVVVIPVLVDDDGRPVGVHQQIRVNQSCEQFGLHGTISGGVDIRQVAVIRAVGVEQPMLAVVHVDVST